MATKLPYSWQPFFRALFPGKVHLLLIAGLFSVCNVLSASTKPAHKLKYKAAKKIVNNYPNVNNLSEKAPGSAILKKPNAFAPPSFSYATPQTYLAGVAITPLAPTGGAAAAPGYSNSAVALGSGFSGPTAVAMDGKGNMYVADYGDKLVEEIPAGGNTPQIIGSGFNDPYGVAVDAAGNIYVTDYGGNAVYKIPAGNGTPVAIGGTGFRLPKGIAVDAAGDVYVADFGHDAVKVIPAGSNTPQTIGSGFSGPVGVAVDAQGNLYVGDKGNNAVKEIPAGSNTPVIIGAGFNGPSGVAADASGNVYVGDYLNNLVKEIPAGSNTPVIIGGTGFSHPDGVALDGAGNVFVTDYANNAVKQIKPTGGYYIGPFLPQGLSFNNTTGILSGTPTISSLATTYTVTAYNNPGSSTATLSITVNPPPLPAISYAGPQTYTAYTGITPLSPTSSNVAAPGYSSTPVILGSGFSGPTGVAIDAAGNAYVADYGNKVVEKIPAGGNTPQIIGSGFTDPYGVAVDAAGDVFVADYGGNAVYKIPPGNGTPITIGFGFKNPTGIAVDAACDVYVADFGHNAIKKIPAGSNTPQTIGSGFSGPVGIAVDAQGNVYVGDKGNNAVKKIPAGSNTPQIIGSVFNAPSGIAVDAAGNVYVGDYENNLVKMIPAGSNTPVIIGGVRFSHPDGVATDGAGNVYVADYTNNAVKQIKPTGGYYVRPFLPQGLSFNNTTGVFSGTPTISSLVTTYTVTAYNNPGSSTATLSITVNPPPLPSISYPGPQTYTEGTAIIPLSPTSSNVAAPGYGSPVVLTSGVNGPTGVAVDAAGNVYVTDYETVAAVTGAVSHGAVYKIPAGSNTPQIIGSGISYPWGVAVSAAGDIYVTDAGDHAVKKILAGSNTTQTIASGFEWNPTTLAIDAAGDIFMTSFSGLWEIPAGSNTPQIKGPASFSPQGVAVDAAGNIYVGVSDYVIAESTFQGEVMEIPAGSNTPRIVGTGFNYINAVAVDAAGNVYVADEKAIKEIPVGGGAPITLSTAFGLPYGVAVDGAGNVYVTDYANNAVKQIKPIGGYYVGPFLPAGLSFNNTTGILSGTPTTGSPATNYTITAYNNYGSSTAALSIMVISSAPPVLSYSSPQTFTVGTAITPVSPTSSGVAAAGYSSSPLILGSGFNAPSGVAADGAGNLYVADFGNKLVKKIPTGSNTPVTIGSGFTDPYGVAADDAGDVYVADYGANAVYKIPAGNGTPVIIGAGFSNPTGVAIDAAGNVYVVDNGNNAVKEIPAGSNTPVVLGSGFNNPFGVAVDASGNVYVGDYGNNAVKEIATGSTVPQIIGSGFSNPDGVAVDASGNVFVDDHGNNAVKEIPAGNGTPVTIGAGFKNPEGVAVDAAGNVYVADAGNNAVKQIKPVGGYYIGPFLPTGLSFSNTTGIISGTPTTLSPATNYTVTAYNSFGSSPAKLNIAVLSNDAGLSDLVLSSGPLTPAFAKLTTVYTANVASTVSSVSVTPTTSNANATVQVNGIKVVSGSASPSLPLVTGPNNIYVLVTAQNRTTTGTYTITVTQAAGNAAFRLVNITGLTDSAAAENDGVYVHQGVSPNGDGINDFLQVDGITQYPDNRLMIVDRNGALIYQARGYDNTSRRFDGHSSINGRMQRPGTYFYVLDYTVNGVPKHSTGYIILKY